MRTLLSTGIVAALLMTLAVGCASSESVQGLRKDFDRAFPQVGKNTDEIKRLKALESLAWKNNQRVDQLMAGAKTAKKVEKDLQAQADTFTALKNEMASLQAQLKAVKSDVAKQKQGAAGDQQDIEKRVQRLSKTVAALTKKLDSFAGTLRGLVKERAAPAPKASATE